MNPNSADRHRGCPPSIDLPGLGIKMQLPFDVELHYGGEVPSHSRYQTDIFLESWFEVGRFRGRLGHCLNWIGKVVYEWPVRQFGFDHFEATLLKKFPEMENGPAFCMEHNPSPMKRVFAISKAIGLEPNLSLFADGHESGEFLQKIHRKDVLQTALLEAGTAFDVSDYSGEDFADLGGFLALLKAKKAGDASICIPNFKFNRENREKMGRLFGLEPMEK